MFLKRNSLRCEPALQNGKPSDPAGRDRAEHPPRRVPPGLFPPAGRASSCHGRRDVLSGAVSPQDGEDALEKLVLRHRSKDINHFNLKVAFEGLLPSICTKLGFMDVMPEVEGVFFVGEILLHISKPSDGTDDEPLRRVGVQSNIR